MLLFCKRIVQLNSPLYIIVSIIEIYSEDIMIFIQISRHLCFKE